MSLGRDALYCLHTGHLNSSPSEDGGHIQAEQCLKFLQSGGTT